MKAYLDYAATTPCGEEVTGAMSYFWRKNFANPSGIYGLGREAREAVEVAREKVAALIGADSSEIVFTSGGTESNNTAIKGTAFALKGQGNHIVASGVEHHSVIEACNFLKKIGFKITFLPVDEYGVVDPKDVERLVTEETILVSVMHANNEVGTIQPIEEIGRMTQECGVYFHVDAVQTAGHVAIDVNDLKVSMMSLSAHKLGGPKGVGALYVKKGVRFTPLMHGGHHESRRRASTENVSGIVGLGKAAERAGKGMEQESIRLAYLRKKLEEGIRREIPEIKFNGHPSKRLPGLVNVSVKFIEGESMVLALDERGVACSTGSACTATDLKASHVLLAMGLSHEMAHGSLRISMGRETKEAEIDYVLEVLPGIVERLRLMSPLREKEMIS